MIAVERPPVLIVRTAADFFELNYEVAGGTVGDRDIYHLGLGQLPSLARGVLSFGSVVKPASRDLETAASWFAQAATLIVAGLAGQSRPVRVGPRERPLIDRKDLGDGWLLADGLLACWIARDEDVEERLATMPVDPLRDALGVDEYALAWGRALQALAVCDEGGVSKHVAAVHAEAAPRRLYHHHPERARLTLLLADALLPLAARDEVAFEAALGAALRAHHDFYEAPEQKDERPQGYVALGPLGLACLAHDRGLKVDIASDYVPRALITRSYARDAVGPGKVGRADFGGELPAWPSGPREWRWVLEEPAAPLRVRYRTGEIADRVGERTLRLWGDGRARLEQRFAQGLLRAWSGAVPGDEVPRVRALLAAAGFPDAPPPPARPGQRKLELAAARGGSSCRRTTWRARGARSSRSSTASSPRWAETRCRTPGRSQGWRPARPRERSTPTSRAAGRRAGRPT
jgi:hypothetical protein